MNLFVKIFGSYDGKASLDAAKRDVQELDQATDKASKGGLSSISKALLDMGKIAGGIVIAQGVMKLPGLFSSMVGGASDLSESMSKVNVVFGENAGAINTWSDGAAKSLGMTKGAALEAAGTFGNFLQAMGATLPTATEMSKSMVQLATDLGSFNNANPEEVILALRAGLSGEAEPMKKFGVALSEAAVQAKGAQLGLGNLGKEMTEQEKITARYAIIMEQTATAQGDFERTSGGLANQSKILKAQLGDLSADIGGLLLPIVSMLVGKFIEVLPVLIEIGTVLGVQLAEAATAGFNAAQPLIDLLVSLAGLAWEGFKQFLDIVLELSKASLQHIAQAFTVIRDFAQAEVAPKLLEVAGAIQAIVDARIDQVAPHFDRVRTSIAGIDTQTLASGFNSIRDAAAPAVAILQPLAERVLKALSDGYRDVKQALEPLGPALAELGSALRPLAPLIEPIGKLMGTYVVAQIALLLLALEGIIKVLSVALVIAIDAAIVQIKAIAATIDFVTKVFTEWPPKIGQALGATGAAIKANVDEFVSLLKSIGTAIADPERILREIGKAIALGLLYGLKDGFNAVKDEVGSWGGKIKDLKGPLEVDRVLLMEEGIAISEGLLKGLTKGAATLPDLLHGLAGEIKENMESDATQIIAWINGLGDDVRLAMSDVFKSIDWKQYGKTLFEDMSIGNTIPDWMLTGTNDPGKYGIKDGREVTAGTRTLADDYADPNGTRNTYIGGGQNAALPNAPKVGQYVPGVGTWNGQAWEQYAGATYAAPASQRGMTGGNHFDINIQALDGESVKRVIPEVARQLNILSRQTGVTFAIGTQ